MATTQIPKHKGRWYCYLTAYDPKTKKRSRIYLKENGKTRSFRTKREARDADAGWRLERKKRPKEMPGEALFGKVVEDWFEIQSAKISASTKRRYSAHKDNLTEGLKDFYVAQITARDIEKFLAAFAETHSARTVNVTLEKLKTVLRLARDWGYIENSPAENVRPYKQHKTQIDVLTPEEVLSVAQNATERARAIILTCYYTGMRIGETLSLDWRQVNFERQEITVRGNVKTDAAVRVIPMTSQLYDHLLPKRKDSGLLFTTKTGKLISQGNFRRDEWYPALKKAKAKRATPHALRHSFISYLISLGMDPKVIQELAGHRSIVTTMNEYGHLFEGAKRTAIESMSQALEVVATTWRQKQERKPPLTIVK